MRVLATAYCCAPDAGSEQAFGWWWVTSCAETHDVTVLTPSAQRAAIEARAGSLPEGLHFEYVDGPRRVSSSGNALRFERLQQYLWELRAVRRARSVARRTMPEVGQRVTTGTWRVPSCLAFTDVPLVLGPLAGSERPPPTLLSGIDRRGRLKEGLRALQIRAARLDPLVRLSLRRARVILAAGPMTYEQLHDRYADKTLVATRAFPHRNIERTTAAPLNPSRGTHDLCWVGRLVPRKGLELILTALADPRLRSCQLHVLGDGTSRPRYEQLAERLGVADRVAFHGQVEQREVFERVRTCDLFVFTSLHDLMGQALSEAMQLGAACVVLDWSGPAALAGDEGALKVPVSDFAGTATALADAIAAALDDPALLERLRKGAIARSDALVDPERWRAERDDVFERAVAAARR